MRRLVWIGALAAFVFINVGIAGVRIAHAAGGVHPDAFCNSPNPCLTWNNNGNGVGLFGVGSKNNGVEGHVKAASPLGLTASGVFGADYSTGTSNAGVSASSLNGTGLIAFGNRTGVFADATNNQGLGTGLFASGSQYGVWAQTQGVGGGIAVRAVSEDRGGYMFYGASTDSAGVFSVSDTADVGISGNLYDAQAVTAGGGLSSSCNAPSCQIAVLGASATGYGVYGQANAPTSIGVEALGAGGYIMEGQNSGLTPVFDLDDSGNLTISGLLTTAGSCHVGCAPAHHAGRHVSTYAAQSTEPVTEDFGEAQMVNGAGYVKLDPAFANVIESNTDYLVFITPEGDSKGLYVTEKSASGFAVRENESGRSTLAFDYRIVAKPYGSSASRLPMTIARPGERHVGPAAPSLRPVPMTQPQKPRLAHI